MLHDQHNRPINYLRIAVTDRCNLRCFYCMPEEGINYVPKTDLLSYEEIIRLLQILAPMGIQKLRITGGEPFLRKDMMQLLENLAQIDGLEQIHLTTNGTLTAGLIPQLKAIGIKSVNLSLDTLNPERFFKITRRDVFDKVMTTLHELLKNKMTTKINTVVMDGQNTDDIIPMTELSKEHPIGIRFIEEMPFNGTGANYQKLTWDHHKILALLKQHYPNIEKIPDPPYSTSFNYHIPGYQGTVGIIPAYSRTFCGTCNRIRITPKGLLKTCLYDDGIFNIRNFMRNGASDEALKATFLEALANKPKDGFEAENNRNKNFPISESMATIGG